MTKEIEEAARALLNFVDEGGDVPEHVIQIRNWQVFIDLRAALNPKLTRDEVVQRLEHICEAIGDKPQNPSLIAMKQTIELLQKPSFQWIENTGVRPDCKTTIVRLRNGHVTELSDIAAYGWETSDNPLDIMKYIIIEH